MLLATIGSLIHHADSRFLQLAHQLQDAGLFVSVTSEGPLKDKKELYSFAKTHPHKFEKGAPEEAEEHGACIACGQLVWHQDHSAHVVCSVCHETYAIVVGVFLFSPLFDQT